MKTIKSKTTYYNGYKFRSRTEARWAVYFDARGFKYDYETIDFETPYGRYLPDFWLPEFRCFAEVKYIKGFTFNDLRRIYSVVEQTGYDFMLLPGQPDCREYPVITKRGKTKRIWIDQLPESVPIGGFELTHYLGSFYDKTKEDRRIWVNASEMELEDNMPYAPVYTARKADFSHE